MPAIFKKLEVTEEFLNTNPNAYFVFGDNTQRKGTGGAAKLRNHPKAIGFVTKKVPSAEIGSYFRPDEYAPLFFQQLDQLEGHVKNNPHHTFYISKLGSGLANRYRIWELVIKHNLLDTLTPYNNVVFCWEEHEDDFQ
jgi:hypothetical protein